MANKNVEGLWVVTTFITRVNMPDVSPQPYPYKPRVCTTKQGLKTAITAAKNVGPFSKIDRIEIEEYSLGEMTTYNAELESDV